MVPKKLNEIMKIRIKSSVILFILHLPFLIGWKSCCIFQVYDKFLINIFSGSLVNDKFANLKLNVFT